MFPQDFKHSLVFRLIAAVGITLFISIAVWASFNIQFQREKLTQHILAETARLGNTIKLGTHYAMMHNSRDDINQIINNIARQEDIKTIRIYNKAGRIKFTNRISEVDRITNIKAEACDVCHRFEPPVYELSPEKMTRFFKLEDGHPVIGVITPILNERGCATDACHIHPKGKKVLGALDVVVSLKDQEKEILIFERGIILLAVFMFMINSLIIGILMVQFVNQPIHRLIEQTRRIARGEPVTGIDLMSNDEIGQLSRAVNKMGGRIAQKQAELSKQKDKYQTLFEMVPCDITVQDREYRLINYNRRFAEKFTPSRGDYCYKVYKGQDQKCDNCPVERTFKDGKSHFGEESGVNRHGKLLHWLAITSPMKDESGEIIAAMEMNLDITELRLMEDKLRKSEKKYQAIFNNIPNPVFVLDANSLEILNCNASVKTVYGYEKPAIMHKSFLDLFGEDGTDDIARVLKSSPEMNQVRQVDGAGRPLFVDIRISPAESEGRNVFLVTTCDITERLEVAQQLIQASKMATLGEMATGVAHELNQPLSVIKTASGFFMKKIDKGEPIETDILKTLAVEIDGHVDRATRIINHMREFGRKSDAEPAPVRMNTVLQRAFDIFSQQLKVRGIKVVRRLAVELPPIQADASRLEQVFINLLLNARDAIESRWEGKPIERSDDPDGGPKRIYMRTFFENGHVVAEVEDTGAGIPKAIQEKIFEPFFTTKEVGKGTGLGLSISYGIIKDCGGTIQAGYGDDGARFVLKFPAVTTGTEAPEEEGANGSRPVQTTTTQCAGRRV